MTITWLARWSGGRIETRHGPRAPPIPLEGVSVVLLPYSASVESELDEIKEHLRDSLKHYMGAAADVDSLRTAYEGDLVWVGGGELIRGEVSNAQGLVRLVGVPAGEWVLLAWREEAHPGKAPKVRPQETKGFRDIPVSVGHSIVTYWWMRVRVRAGETTSVDLNDRNVWIAAVQEHLQTAAGEREPADSEASLSKTARAPPAAGGALSVGDRQDDRRRSDYFFSPVAGARSLPPSCRPLP